MNYLLPYEQKTKVKQVRSVAFFSSHDERIITMLMDEVVCWHHEAKTLISLWGTHTGHAKRLQKDAVAHLILVQALFMFNRLLRYSRILFSLASVNPCLSLTGVHYQRQPSYCISFCSHWGDCTTLKKIKLLLSWWEGRRDISRYVNPLTHFTCIHSRLFMLKRTIAPKELQMLNSSNYFGNITKL